MNRHVQRALMLLEQSRFDLAEQELRQSLLADPDDPDAHALLGMCLAEREQYDEATREAETAIHHAPDVPFNHYAMARVLLARQRHGQARKSVDEAIRLDPENADFYSLKAAIHINLREWQAALDAALEGLSVDPEHVGCANLRAMALARLGRKAEAQALLDETLAKAPEDDMAHANKGWTLLHQGRPKEAMEHFREALRLNPENDWARSGMIESLKARHVIYRWLLAYFLWMSSLSHKAQWGVIIGLYFIPKVLRGVVSTNPALKIWIYPVVGLFAVFALLTWIADPLFNMLLRLSRFGRYALSRSQIMASNALLACLGGALACAIIGYATSIGRYYAMTVVLVLMTVPVSGTFNMQAGWPRKVLTAYTALLVLLLAGGMLLPLPTSSHPATPSETAGMACLGLWLLGVFGFGWLANGLAMVRVRK